MPFICYCKYLSICFFFCCKMTKPFALWARRKEDGWNKQQRQQLFFLEWLVCVCVWFLLSNALSLWRHPLYFLYSRKIHTTKSYFDDKSVSAVFWFWCCYCTVGGSLREYLHVFHIHFLFLSFPRFFDGDIWSDLSPDWMHLKSYGTQTIDVRKQMAQVFTFCKPH